MAGGRRPASYVSGARHGSAIERAFYERPASPSPGAVNTPTLPPWIPSIWQPTPSKPGADAATSVSTMPVTRRERPPPRGDPSSVLAAALDTAVQSAVTRALGNSGVGAPSSPQVRTESTASDLGVEDDPSDAWSARERELAGMVDSLQQRLDDRNDEVRNLADRFAATEKRMAAEASAARRREEKFATEIATHMRQLTNSIGAHEQKVEERLSTMHDQVKANQGGLAKLRSMVKNCEADLKSTRRWTKEISDETRDLGISMCSEVEKSLSHSEQFERALNDALSKMGIGGQLSKSAAVAEEVEELKRGIGATSEEVATLRSRVKRTDSHIAELSKQASDTVALNGGFEESVRHSIDEVSSVVEGLRKCVAKITADNSKPTNTSDPENAIQSRLDTLESNVKALKKLIESNLRTQCNAENIVKEQVSLITKHVCVAMRQYTARRISENNTLIDRALRARVPDYAKNEEQFVLVREEDPEGNESIDILRTSEASSTASS